MLERLEKRTHLSTTATLDPDTHVLTITATSAFAIKITLDAQLTNILVKNTSDGFNKQFAKAQVQLFNIVGTSGNDSLSIASAITIPAACSMGMETIRSRAPAGMTRLTADPETTASTAGAERIRLTRAAEMT